MQIIKNAPKKPEILQRDGQILKAAKTGIILAVSWSIYTEYNFINSIAAQNLDTFLPPAVDAFIHFLITLFAISIIEGTGLTMLAYFIDNYLNKTLRTNFINCIGAGLLVLLSYSFTVGVSFYGVQTVSKKWVEAPTLSSTSIIDSLAKKEKQDIQRTFSSDSLLIAVNYNNQIEAIKNEYKAKIDKLKRSISNYKRKEQRTGQSYFSARNYLQGKIENLKSEQAQSIGALQAAAGAELKDLIETRRTAANNTRTKAQDKTKQIDNSNTEKQNNYKSELSSTVLKMKYGVLFSLPLLLFCMVIIRNIYFKAGVTEKVQIDDYFYRDSILNKTRNLIRVKWLSFAHHHLDKQYLKLKEIEHTPRVNKVFDRSEITQYVNPYQLNDNQQNFKSDDTISAVVAIGDDTKKERYKATAPAVTGLYDNRIEQEQRNDTQTNLRSCRHCKNDYKYNHNKQIYCSQSCRKAAWKAKNGREPMMKKKK